MREVEPLDWWVYLVVGIFCGGGLTYVFLH
jgi:hypothetical protein